MNALRNPWGKPRVLAVVTGLYILWSLAVAVCAVIYLYVVRKQARPSAL